jgi:hypothetical protein
MIKKARGGDILVVYMSGHGEFLHPTDANNHASAAYMTRDGGITGLF